MTAIEKCYKRAMPLDPDVSQPKRAKSMSIHGTKRSGNENLDTGAQFRYLAFLKMASLLAVQRLFSMKIQKKMS